ncbi:MAG: NUDIX domain-containing protein [Nanoarchaeota archaeon]
MEKRKVSIIIFYDEKGNILLQDRREISKHGEEYGFFGGGIEENETPDEALKREIKEELGITIKEYEFFKKDKMIFKTINLEVERFIYIAPMPDLNKLKNGEGNPVVKRLNDCFNLKGVEHDLDILKEIYKHLNKNHTF